MGDKVQLGDRVRLENTFLLDGVPTSPTSVTLTVVAPDGASTTVATTEEGPGHFEGWFSTAQAGVHTYVWSGAGVLTDVQDGAFRVHALAGGGAHLYATVEDVKRALGMTDQDDDDTIQLALEAACRTIDDYTGRTFGRGEAGEVRYFTPTRSRTLDVGDVLEVAEVALDRGGLGVFAEVLAPSTYRLDPTLPTASRPHEGIVLFGGSTLPARPESVRVTGRFGWTAPPSPIVTATILQATRIWKRTREAPFGIAGLTLEGGGMRLLARLDPDVELLVRPYQRVLVA